VLQTDLGHEPQQEQI